MIPNIPPDKCFASLWALSRGGGKGGRHESSPRGPAEPGGGPVAVGASGDGEVGGGRLGDFAAGLAVVCAAVRDALRGADDTQAAPDIALWDAASPPDRPCCWCL